MGRYIMIVLLAGGLLISLLNLVIFGKLLFLVQFPITGFILYHLYKFKPKTELT